jgi:hypothetical protein
MIDHVDGLLQHLLLAKIPALVDANHIRFQPPDKDFRQIIGNLPGPSLSVYMLDLHENRALYSNERTLRPVNGYMMSTPAPRRIECHYLITAWAGQPSAAFDPTTSEHALLYRVTQVLMDVEPMVPRQAYSPAPLPPLFPEVIADVELPTSVLWEDFPKYAEFWGTMGPNSPWRPGVHFRITLPVLSPEMELGPIVTTITANYENLEMGLAGTWLSFGGRLLDGEEPLAHGWVELATTAGERIALASTDGSGRFSFQRLRAGSYRLRGQATGFAPVEREIALPSDTGEYDLKY